MPKRTDIKRILLIGSGPIVIGQACEFDYSGSQAARALRKEGYEVILVNSNPATIMTDPITADRVYLQELTPESIRRIVEKERPDAVLPTMGGQTALNLAAQLHEEGFWEAMGVEIIGVDIEAIQITEDRQKFRDLMEQIGIDQARSRTARSLLEAKEILQELGGLPVVIRPSFTLGGTGGGIVWTMEEFDRKVTRGLELSPVHQVLIEESVYGWKEYELELLRDANDNVIIVCPIENLDPMGVHTGDSITVAPAQTLTDKQYQRMRDAAIKMMRSIGKFAGGCNVQFAVEPHTGRMIAVEINPRVSRSSALASKATGYPIAKVAARLAVGYTLDELPNDVTGTTSACFEPSIDYVVVKIPRWNFEKFEGVDEELTTQMKAVGEVMAIGRTFPEALQKAWQSLENGYAGLGADREDPPREEVRARLKKPYWDRTLQIRNAFRLGASVEEIHDITHIDPWFLYQIEDIVKIERELERRTLDQLDADFLRLVKQYGFSDVQIAYLLQGNVTEEDVRARRKALGITPTFQLVDTCAAEFPAQTPYYYSTYETENESEVTDREKVIILGAGPNRIGQGIEFDYCCVHGVLAAKEMGYEAIMINCNPETVSTDFDVADKLYFEPVFWERVLDIIEHENRHGKLKGVIVQLGGQTALKLARKLHEHGIPILGTSFPMMDLAEERSKFSALLRELEIPYPPYGAARTVAEAVEVAERIGYPILIRPSYVLGGQGMRIAINKEEVERYVRNILKLLPDNEILLDLFLENGIEVDVDAACDGEEVWIAGIMQHIEPAGVHSGDSTAVLPPFSLSEEVLNTIRRYTEDIARRLQVVGLINVQMVVKDNVVYVIEANPRASRTMPFVAKATGVPVAKIGTQLMLGRKLREFREAGLLESKLKGYAIKEPVFSWDKFPEVPKELGPEMKSTGEAIAFVETLTDEHFRRPYAIRNLYLSR
ncbi:carbamoyl-phosphate synthase large subunit [Rhodothermus marinus]|uniref:carbamoyl-phosphate synthase large subunit n=1 Tax=Rhodothermus marinus TaxID=29549 RepID=UPI001D3FB9D8|nr:carbamoyl-phosphate synthase large subunit [Rhodothermus marinus]MBO2490537.1 carbamoyl-phosphate synthase large subunit [Rhodothermus marinus]